MADVTESPSIIGVVEAAGKVKVNTLLHWVHLHFVRLSQFRSIKFNPQESLAAVCLFSLLRRDDIEYVVPGGHCYPQSFPESQQHIKQNDKG